MKYTKIIINSGSKLEATRWCKDTFGQSRPPGTSFGNMRWWKRDLEFIDFSYTPYARAFYFREAKDATLFRMMWG